MDERGRKRWLLALNVGFVLLALWAGAHRLAADWPEVRAALTGVDVTWPLVLASSLPVLLAYVILIGTWRVMLRAWGGNLAARDASAIWFVSNLGRYIPGKLWQIAAMSGMAQRCGVSPVAAAGSSLVVNLANVLTGFLVVLATGAQVLAFSGSKLAGPALALGLALVIVLLPKLLPVAMNFAARITGRPQTAVAIPPRALWVAVLGTASAWLLYGLGFQVLAWAVWGHAPGGSAAYIAAFTGSYLVGYLALLAPGGIVVRELMLVESLRVLALAGPAEGLVLALASRLWLTVLEIVLGVLFIPLVVRLQPRPLNPLDTATDDRA